MVCQRRTSVSREVQYSGGPAELRQRCYPGQRGVVDSAKPGFLRGADEAIHSTDFLVSSGDRGTRCCAGGSRGLCSQTQNEDGF